MCFLYWSMSNHLSTYEFLTLKSILRSANDFERDTVRKIEINITSILKTVSVLQSAWHANRHTLIAFSVKK